MAAVSGVDGSVHHALSLARRELAIRVARRERDRLRNSAKDKVAYDLLPHLYACATLCGGLQREEAVAIAQQQLEFVRKVYVGGPGEAVDDVARWQGTVDRLKSLEPDLLGEALLLVIFDESETIGPEVIERLAPTASDRIAAVLIRLVQDFGYLSPEDAKDAQRVRWAKQALAWIAALVSAGKSDISVLINLESALPESTLVLRATAVVVTSALVSHLRNAIDGEHHRGKLLLARMLNNLSNRQSATGQHEIGLCTIQEAVSICRALVCNDREAFLPDLAQVLNTMSVRYSDAKEHKTALFSSGEAVSLYRELITLNRELYLHSLALSLNNLSVQQSNADQREMAINSIIEAVALYRELIIRSREAFLSELAQSLNNLSVQQSEIGHCETAICSMVEAVAFYRELLETNREAFLPDLARSLNNLSIQQSGMGHSEVAICSIVEAVAIRRELAYSNNEVFLPDLVLSLSGFGDRLEETGRLLEARDAAAEALFLLAPFFYKHPEKFSSLAKGTVSDYLVRSKELGMKLEADVLEPYCSLR